MFSEPVIWAEMHFLSVFTKLHVGLSVILAQVLLGDLERGVMTFDRKNDVQLLIGLPFGLQ